MSERLAGVLPDRLARLVDGTRFGQFLSVGILGAACDTTATLALQTYLGVQYDLAKLFGAELAIVVMFLLNERWTFASEGAAGVPATLKRLVTSNVVRSGGLAVQLVTYYFLRRAPVDLVIAGFDLWRVGAIVCAIGVAFVVNYVTESTFTWRVGEE